MSFTVAEEMVVLRKKRERIIFNARQVNPVYFPKGGDKIIELLKELKNSGSFTSPDNEIYPPELIDFLKFHSIIVPQNQQNEIAKTGCGECNSQAGLSHHRSVYLLLSHSCNQACIYCLNGIKTYQKKKSIVMSEEVAFKSLKNTFNTISENGRMEIVFFGGEPLMNWPLAKKIIDYSENTLLKENKTKRIVYHLTTNLTLFPSDLIETAKKYNMTFLVNIDGPEDIHNKTRPFTDGGKSFYITAKNIEKLVKNGINVALRATVTKHNVERMVDVTKTHKELGGSGSAFVPLNPVDSDIKLLSMSLCPSAKKFEKGLKDVLHSGIWKIKELYPYNEYEARLNPMYKNKWGCGAPFGNTPVITAEGEIYSCIYLVGNKKYELGNITSDDFPRQNVVSHMLDIVNVDMRNECKECSFRYLCGGGCPVGVFSIAHNPKAGKKMKDYVHKIACTVSKTVLSELIWHMAGRLL